MIDDDINKKLSEMTEAEKQALYAAWFEVVERRYGITNESIQTLTHMLENMTSEDVRFLTDIHTRAAKWGEWIAKTFVVTVVVAFVTAVGAGIVEALRHVIGKG